MKYPWDWAWLEANHPITGREWNHVCRGTFRIPPVPVPVLPCFLLAAWMHCFGGLAPVYLLVDCFTCLPYPQPFQLPWLTWDTRNRLSFFPFILNKQWVHGCSDKSRETSYSHHFIGLVWPCLGTWVRKPGLTLFGYRDQKTVATHLLSLCGAPPRKCLNFQNENPWM